MWKVVLLEKAEEKPEACVLVVFIFPFQAGRLADKDTKADKVRLRGGALVPAFLTRRRWIA